ncbi:MAG: asparagine synthase-related protein [Patescibacteria group bacterium]|nr:asparagine synthase-related protein [Patescibacteria group bacterium]
MCGICAIIGKENQSSEQLEGMLKAIACRGENNHFNESESFGVCVLGMNRLAIVDRERAKQPITSADGRYTIVFNGEIYNYKELKEELENLGFAFHTDSDTEVVVNGYDAWGSDLLIKLRGMFAFFIYDNQTNNFFAARDPFGIKPLYYAKDVDNTYYFASEIKAISPIEKINKIELFPPAHYMTNGELKSYWRVPENINSDTTEEQLIQKTRELFDQAVKRRVQTDLPIAVYLSGGIDSTAVLATALKYHNDVTAVIVGSKDATDRIVATKYCEENNIKYVVKEPPNEEELSKSIPEIVRLTESFEPNMIRQSAVSYYIAQAAAEKGFKIILCGEGADEIFAGYPEFTQGLDNKAIEERTRQFIKDLHRTQLQRVDRTSMAFTTEVRVPFLDLDLADFVMQIPAKYKIVETEEKTITKYILRKAMEDRLPDYIYDRDKVVLSEGAGYKGNQKIGGLFYDIASSKVSDEELSECKLKYPQWNLETKEEVYYFNFYKDFGYLKAAFNQRRTAVNKVNTLDKSLSQKVIEQFNTWSFKREQPNDEEGIERVVEEAVGKNTPIPFVLYWGKGEKNTAGKQEIDALNMLENINDRIKQAYKPGAEFTLVFTDTHAVLNGYSEGGIQQYYSSVKILATERKINCLCMSEIAPLDYDKLLIQSRELEINDRVLEILKESSSKHYKRSSDHALGAKLYYNQNQIEKSAAAKNFPKHIFMTYSSSALNDILPELPIFYMYSMEKGTSIKPWFAE